MYDEDMDEEALLIMATQGQDGSGKLPDRQQQWLARKRNKLVSQRKEQVGGGGRSVAGAPWSPLLPRQYCVRRPVLR
jgi:hypothetical protein